MHATRIEVPVTTSSGGAADEKSAVVTGRIIDIEYVADGTTPYDNTVDMTITAEKTGRAILSKANVAAAFIAAPRQPTHDLAGVATLYAPAGAAVLDHIVLAQDRVRIVLAQGGATKTGIFYITVA